MGTGVKHCQLKSCSVSNLLHLHGVDCAICSLCTPFCFDILYWSCHLYLLGKGHYQISCFSSALLFFPPALLPLFSQSFHPHSTFPLMCFISLLLSIFPLLSYLYFPYVNGALRVLTPGRFLELQMQVSKLFVHFWREGRILMCQVSCLSILLRWCREIVAQSSGNKCAPKDFQTTCHNIIYFGEECLRSRHVRLTPLAS